VGLIYLDPPFNSAANYNVLFRAPDGRSSESQLEAFEDTWHWGDSAERAYSEVLTQATHTDAAAMLRGIVTAVGKNDMTAYLSMMAVRLIELHRVLKLTGSLYLHCDPTASHYLKVVLEEAAKHGFASTGPGKFRKITIKTVEDLLHNVADDAERLPPIGKHEGFRRAPKERAARGGRQAALEL
jgi:hypothetical protein